jgi:hypothetical protein
MSEGAPAAKRAKTGDDAPALAAFPIDLKQYKSLKIDPFATVRSLPFSSSASNIFSRCIVFVWVRLTGVFSYPWIAAALKTTWSARHNWRPRVAVVLSQWCAPKTVVKRVLIAALCPPHTSARMYPVCLP